MLKSTLSGGNVINAINLWTAAMVLYGAGIKEILIKLTKKSKNS